MFKCLGDSPPIISHLMSSSFSPPLLNYNIQKQEQKKSWFFLSQLYWIDVKKWTETRLYRPQPVRCPLPFIIIYTNIVLVLKSQSASCATTETSTILVYMILNGKGRLTGCGPHGYSLLFPGIFNMSIQYSWLFMNKNIFALVWMQIQLVAIWYKN